MLRSFTRLNRFLLTVFLVLLCLTLLSQMPFGGQEVMASPPHLLSDPFLQLPTETSIRVVWFTQFAGSQHTVSYGDNLAQTAVASTTKLSRTREDQNSLVGEQTQAGQIYKQPTQRDVWRHEAEITRLTPGIRVPYMVTSVQEDGKSVSSAEFTLAPKPAPGTPLRILLTSDHQLKPMTAANLQKVVEIGKVDAVFFVGDLVNIPDRASEWFDDNRGGALFPCLQGRASYELDKNGIKTTYTGGEIIQHAPLFTALGNHEVMGRANGKSLNDELENAIPEQAVRQFDRQFRRLNPTWLKNNSFNTDTYEEIFTLPASSPGGEKYYALSFGDVRLVVLYATNIWRTSSLEATAKGKYQERDQDLNNPEQWGYGQHIFEAIAKGSPQYNWLEQELNSAEFQQAKYKVVMLHHPPHSLGENIVPAYTDPVQVVERNSDGTVKSVGYEYPKQADYIIRDLVPLLEAAHVQLVFYGHSHLWNRFVSASGMHFLEASNVGNSYGAFWNGKQRNVPISDSKDYVAIGNPNGLEPVIPSLAPLLDLDGQPQPYIASNDITVFSIFDTATGVVSSYRFDTREPKSQIVKFDEFKLS